MNISKPTIGFLVLLFFSLVSFTLFLKKETKILKVDKIQSLTGKALDLEVETTLYKNLNKLYFTSNDKITQIALYDIKHNLIYKNG